MSRTVGTISRGIRTPIIRNGDDLVKIVADSVIEASQNDKFEIKDRDIIGVTEAVLARAQNNYVTVDDIAEDVKNKFGEETVGLIFTITSRNRFAICLRGIAKGLKKIILMLNYPSDEVGNHLITLDMLDEKGVNPYSDVLTLKKFRELFGYNEHQFTGITSSSLKEYLNNKLTLSYSSLDKYYRCPFSFYIGNILKLNIYEETFFQLIGTLFHRILEKILNTNLNYDELWDEELKALDHDFTFKERFFLTKLKQELSFIIDVIKEQEKYTNLHDELHEERVYINLKGDIKITFTGIIDKIKYKKENNQTIIAIIDYKTGNPNLDLTTIPYGIGMQLPVYLYLAKNTQKLTNIKVAGFYLQKILNNEITVDNTHTYEQLKKKNLLLQGFSNEDI